MHSRHLSVWCVCVLVAAMSAAVVDGAAVPAPSGTADAVLIFLHGLGDSGDGWCAEMARLLRNERNLRILCPNAPIKPVRCSGQSAAVVGGVAAVVNCAKNSRLCLCVRAHTRVCVRVVCVWCACR